MDLLIQNMLGAASFVLTCVALFMLRKQMNLGWIVFLPSYTLQIVIFYMTEQWFLLFQMIVLFILSTNNYIAWEKQNGNIGH